MSEKPFEDDSIKVLFYSILIRRYGIGVMTVTVRLIVDYIMTDVHNLPVKVLLDY